MNIGENQTNVKLLKEEECTGKNISSSQKKQQIELIDYSEKRCDYQLLSDEEEKRDINPAYNNNKNSKKESYLHDLPSEKIISHDYSSNQKIEVVNSGILVPTTCPFCFCYQAVSTRSNRYTCYRCKCCVQFNNAYAPSLLVCWKCQKKVMFQSGVSNCIQCLNCSSYNYI